MSNGSAPLTYSQLQSLWTQTASGTQYDTPAWASLMAAIALAESSGVPSNTNPNDNGGTQTSWGLWQISDGTHNAPPGWSNPATNARMALQKLQTQGLSAWGTYTSGAYKGYLTPGTSPPPNAGAASGAQTGQPGGAVTTGISLNPVTWVEAPIKGLEWANNFITGGVVSGISTEVQGLTGIVQGFVGITKTLSKMAQLMTLLFQPARWLRVGAFILGVVFLLLGVRMMGESLK